ncbi:MAG: ATP-binding protein [Mariprofundaceae bacterium]
MSFASDSKANGVSNMKDFKNPFKPGAGHTPPYLAGRKKERDDFLTLLDQDTILENVILTGLRGVGKTVLLESFKPLAVDSGWLWVGTDLSESASISEQNIAVRLITDLSLVTSNTVVKKDFLSRFGFFKEVEEIAKHKISYEILMALFKKTPGLVTDKLKTVLEFAWAGITASNDSPSGIIFAYDEAQNLADHSDKKEFPTSVLLEVFQSLQKKGLPLMLTLTGLPTLFPKLVEVRTYAERMFHVIELKGLSNKESKEAILVPITDSKCPITLDNESVDKIVKMSGGYPYFIQFICKEVYDLFLVNIRSGQEASVPTSAIEHKLDTDFFAGRWARSTDRQKELMELIAKLDNANKEFMVQDIVDKSKGSLVSGVKPFRCSNTSQMLDKLGKQGLIYKSQYGKYAFAVPLFAEFINRKRNAMVAY